MSTLQNVLDQKFLDACQEKPLEDIEKCAKLVKNNPRTSLGFGKVCRRGSVEMVDFLISQGVYPEKNHHKIGFYIACKDGHFNLVKYFLNRINKSQELTNNEFKELIEEGFISACSSPNTKLVKYFLTEPVFESYNLLDKIDAGFAKACYENRFETALYLMHSEDLKTHVDPTHNQYEGLVLLMIAGHFNFFEYLVLGQKIKISREFKEDLIEVGAFSLQNKDRALKILENREANDKIEQFKDDMNEQLLDKKSSMRVKI